MSGKDYCGIIGSLLYAAMMTRPDIAFYVSVLCKFMQDPTIEAYHAALSVASSLNTTADLGVTFGGSPRECCIAEAAGCNLLVVSDASWGREPRPSAGGFVHWRNGPLCWLSRNVKMPPQSSCESEIAALVMLLKEGMFVKQLLDFLDVVLDGPVCSVTDNKGAYDVVRNPGATKRTVHFDRWLHFARELYLHNAIKIFLTTTDNMMADMFTKAVDKTAFLRCRAYVMNLSNDKADSQRS